MLRRRFLAAVAGLSFALVVGVATPALATAPVHNGDKVVFVGDSITAFGWMSVSGGLVDQINAAIPSRTLAISATVSGALAHAVAGNVAATLLTTTLPPIPITAVNSGIAGDTAAVLATQVASRITDYNPNVIVIEEGINGQNVPPSQMGADYSSILSQIRAWSPTVPIVCVSILGYYEQWQSTTPPTAIPVNDISPYNVALKAACDSFAGTTWKDNYHPFYLYESTHNTPEPGAQSGILLLDDRHPNPTGQLQMGNWTIGSFQVLP